jgi:hypothetical protein
MKKLIFDFIQPIILITLLVLFFVWNTVGANHSVDLLYVFLGISLVFTILNHFSKEQGSNYLSEITHLLIFMYLAFSLLVIGGSISRNVTDLLFYILLLVSVWIGLGYTGLRIKRLLKL